MACRVDGAALSEVRSILGDRLIERPEQLTRVAADGSHLSCQPSACAIPRDPAEVQQLVRWARRHRVPLVVRGGGTSLDGESVPVPGAVVIDLSGWTTVHEIDPTDRIGRIGPGVLNRSLQEAAAPHGLFFPPNPGSWRTSSIGGNASTNASGPRSFRYGPTRSWIRAADVVLGTGETITVGGRSAKRSTGPDLLQMLIGSEGTLGIFTEITVGLAPSPARRSVIAAALPASLSIGSVAAALGRGLTYGLSAIEYPGRYLCLRPGRHPRRPAPRRSTPAPARGGEWGPGGGAPPPRGPLEDAPRRGGLGGPLRYCRTRTRSGRCVDRAARRWTGRLDHGSGRTSVSRWGGSTSSFGSWNGSRPTQGW